MKKESTTDNCIYPEKETGNISSREKATWSDRQLERLFGEALGEAPTPDETRDAWQAFSHRIHKRQKYNYRVVALGIAAALIAVILVCYPLFKPEVQEVEVFASLEVPQVVTFREEGKMVIVTTPPATITSIELSDGSKVLLGANSRLEYEKQFADTLRNVTLAGEARFEVTKDAARPFTVCTEQLQTRVLGTVFDVKAYPGYRADITLYEGRVNVSIPEQKQSQEMSPGEQVSMTDRGMLKLAKVDMNRQKSWTENEFYFDNTELIEVMQEIGAWYNISVLFHSRPLLNERIYFRISRQLPIHAVLDALNDLRIAQFSMKEEKVIVTALP